MKTILTILLASVFSFSASAIICEGTEERYMGHCLDIDDLDNHYQYPRQSRAANKAAKKATRLSGEQSEEELAMGNAAIGGIDHDDFLALEIQACLNYHGQTYDRECVDSVLSRLKSPQK